MRTKIESKMRWGAILIILIALSGCDKYTTTLYNDPVYTFDKTDYSKLPDKGERYTRRGEYIVDISDMGPKADEPYAHYKQRLINTLATQQKNRDELNNRISEAERSVADLDGQISSMSQQNAQMRLVLASPVGTSAGTAAMGAQQARYSCYRVKKGDTLQGIAHEVYGTHTAWLTLYRFNRTRLKDGPNRIEVGTSLFVPVAVTLPRS